MHPVKTKAVLFLTALLLAGCSSTPEAQDPYNPADEQRSRASKAQGELSTETSGK